MRPVYCHIALFFVLLTACGPSERKAQDRNEMDSPELIAHIEALEEELFDSMKSPSDSIAEELIYSYERFATKERSHEMSPEYLFRAANVARSFGQFDRALGHYQRILKDHPAYENRIETEFLVAFMYDNDFNDKAKAEMEYRRIMKDYPDHLFGKEAANRLQHLHLSDSELIEMFEKRKQSEAGDQAESAN